MHRKFSGLVLYVFSLLSLAACMGPHYVGEIGGTPSEQVYSDENFKLGNYRLGETIWLRTSLEPMKTMKRNYADGNFNGILNTIIGDPSSSDLFYWYLAEVAKNRGYNAAALTYYQLAYWSYFQGWSTGAQCGGRQNPAQMYSFEPKEAEKSELCPANLIRLIERGISATVVALRNSGKATNNCTYNSSSCTGFFTVQGSDSSYTGFLLNGSKFGKGKLTTTNGLTYEGSFSNDTFEGFGKLVDPNGDTYVGFFEQGEPSYRGVWTNDNGKAYLAFYTKGTITGTKPLTEPLAGFSNTKHLGRYSAVTTRRGKTSDFFESLALVLENIAIDTLGAALDLSIAYGIAEITGITPEEAMSVLPTRNQNSKSSLRPSTSPKNCSCECVNGTYQAICSGYTAVLPVCEYRVCVAPTPGYSPNRFTAPPPGTTNCEQEQVYNAKKYRYEFKTVCR
jgi:hypothetical protein